MLVLTRKAGEQIRIGDEIVLTVTEIKGNRIKLGIDAPKDVSIVRGELCDWSEKAHTTRSVLVDGPSVGSVQGECR